MSPVFWGGLFPDVGPQTFWGPHFPDGGQDPAYFSGYGHPGSATFALDLESGFSVKYSWVTDIIKRYSGTEQRIAVNDAPKQFYNGIAILQNSDPRKIRGYLARYIAAGSQFLLGLPYEELTLTANALGTRVYVNATHALLCDWSKRGQRVIVMDPDGVSINAVIQNVGSGYLDLDVAPGSIGREHARIMPAMAVFLDPKQGFGRSPVNAEQWAINARAALFDFVPTLATIALSAVTVSGVFAGTFATSRKFGLIGNTLTLEFDGNVGFPAVGSLTEVGPITLIKFRPGVTTLANLETLLNLSSNFKLTGTWNPVSVIGEFDEFFVYAAGAQTSGTIGAGVTLTTYDSRPVWDSYIQVEGTAEDSIQALTQVIDMDGVPYAIGSADYADWGRHVMLRSTQRAVWQWFKLFVATVRGRQRAFWLPSWRPDFTFISKSTNTITVSGTDSSDFSAWYPAQRDRLQIIENSGVVTYARITNAVDNGNGTVTLTIGTTLASSSVFMISWLELCRFESDDFDVEWKSQCFTMQTKARVVRA